jgi:FixJ family two-component response regulator
MRENRDGPVSPTMVLVVDDDPAVRNSLKFSLELEGFAVRLYADGRELLDDPHLPTYGCLVIDQVMPGLLGLDVVAALRNRGVTSPAILITPHANPKVRQNAATAGVTVIEKPFFGNTLIDAIRASFA